MPFKTDKSKKEEKQLAQRNLVPREKTTHLQTALIVILLCSIFVTVAIIAYPILSPDPQNLCGNGRVAVWSAAIDQKSGGQYLNYSNTWQLIQSGQIHSAVMTKYGLMIGQGKRMSWDRDGVILITNSHVEICQSPEVLIGGVVNDIYYNELTGEVFVATDNDTNESTNNSGVYRFDGIQWEYYGLNEGLPSTDTYTLEVDEMGQLYVGTFNGAAEFIPEENRWSPTSGVEAVSQDHIRAMNLVSNSEFWTGTIGEGLYYFHHNTMMYFNTENQPLLGSNNIRVIESDPMGSVWVGADPGISRYFTSVNYWTQFTLNGELTCSVFDIQFELLPDTLFNTWVTGSCGTYVFINDMIHTAGPAGLSITFGNEQFFPGKVIIGTQESGVLIQPLAAH